MQLGLYLKPTGKAMPFESFNSIKADGRAGSEASQTTVNTEAKDVIRDLFPNIPEKDINIIITTAFQKVIIPTLGFQCLIFNRVNERWEQLSNCHLHAEHN